MSMQSCRDALKASPSLRGALLKWFEIASRQLPRPASFDEFDAVGFAAIVTGWAMTLSCPAGRAIYCAASRSMDARWISLERSAVRNIASNLTSEAVDDIQAAINDGWSETRDVGVSNLRILKRLEARRDQLPIQFGEKPLSAEYSQMSNTAVLATNDFGKALTKLDESTITAEELAERKAKREKERLEREHAAQEAQKAKQEAEHLAKVMRELEIDLGAQLEEVKVGAENMQNQHFGAW